MTGPTPLPAFPEFVALMALLMALTALSIDIMLPSLPQIGAAFAVPDRNDVQHVVTGYMLGLAFGQLVWGPISDRWGRKGPLLLGLLVFGVGSLVSIAATSFSILLSARVLQGLGGAAARVISVAIIRDLYAGRQMARVMSIVMMVFITVPVIAPSIGQALAHIGSWRWAFYVLLAAAAIGIVWAGLRLPETASSGMAVGRRLTTTALAVVRTKTTVWYSVASGFMFGCLVSYIVSAQQVFVDVFALGAGFPWRSAPLPAALPLRPSPMPNSSNDLACAGSRIWRWPGSPWLAFCWPAFPWSVSRRSCCSLCCWRLAFSGSASSCRTSTPSRCSPWVRWPVSRHR